MKTIKKLNTYENNIIASQNNIFNIYELKGQMIGSGYSGFV